jgi:hypothetical protein
VRHFDCPPMSKGIKRVGRRGGPDIGFEAVAADDIDRGVKEARDVCDVEVAAGRLSPRATEPNTATCRMPRARKSRSWRRSVAMASFAFTSEC